MTSRAPDSEQIQCSGAVAFGHRHLSTSRESSFQQLVFDSTANVLVTADVRLDNSKELQAALDIETLDDVSILLHAYLKWGERCLQRLRGDFAFAIWDGRTKLLFCARDHLGAKGFSYTWNSRFFAFATEGAPLTGLPGVSKELTEELIANLIVPGVHNVVSDKTWYRDVKCLMPGTKLVLQLDKDNVPGVSRYWQLEPQDNFEFTSLDECVEAFREVFDVAVTSRLRKAKSPALMLSGGMDSGAIAATVEGIPLADGAHPIPAYSTISDDAGACVESQKILSLAKRSCFVPQILKVPSFIGMLNWTDVEELALSAPHPADNSILLPLVMAKAAARDGHKVLVHGVSGDLVQFSSGAYIGHIMREAGIRKAWQECKAASQYHTFLNHKSAAHLFIQNAYSAFVPLKLRREVRRLKNQDYVDLSLINADFAEKSGVREKIVEANREEVPYRDVFFGEFKASVELIASGLSAYDRICARFGMESRDPWADLRVVEFFNRLPYQFKVNAGWTKYLVREAFKNELGIGYVRRSGKEHLGYHFHKRLMAERRDLVVHVRNHYLSRIAMYYNVEKVKKIFDNYLAGDQSLYRLVYKILCVVLWLESNGVVAGTSHGGVIR